MQVIVPPGLSLLPRAGVHEVKLANIGSLIWALVSDTLPVLVSTIVYVMLRPAALMVVGLGVLVSDTDGVWVAVAVTEAVRVIVEPVGVVPLMVAVLVRVPASRSAWVTVWVPVQLIVSPGCRVTAPAGVQLSGEAVGNIGSVI